MGNLQTPISVQKLQTALHAKAKAEPEYRFYLLYDKIYRPDILEHAWRSCKANKGAAGVDGVRFEDIEAYGVDRWLGELAQRLRKKDDRPEAQHRQPEHWTRHTPRRTHLTAAVESVHAAIHPGMEATGVRASLVGVYRQLCGRLVICCKGRADEAMAAMRRMMERLKLTVNDDKTHLCRIPQERFDFLGYTFGRCYNQENGRAYIGTRPSKKSIKRMINRITEETDRRRTLLDADYVVGRLNRKLTG